MKPVRINKFLADAGICSRRKAEDLVIQGRVRINGKTATELSTRVDPARDRVHVDGSEVAHKPRKIYIVLNKPEGVISTASDEMDRETVMDYVSEVGERLHYAGRLDADTSGLVFLTNDGEVSQKLSHPRGEIIKTYTALVKGMPDARSLRRLAEGIEIDDYRTLPADVRIVRRFSDSSEVEISISEGRKRQVRKMFKAIKHPVIKLKRTAIGEISLGRLKPGTYRHLRKEEMDFIIRL